MSDANRVQLSYVKESVFGQGKSGSRLQILRHTGESLKQDTAAITSEELRADRQIADIIRTGVTVSGNIGFELSYGTFDDLLQALLCSNGWSTEKKMSKKTTISAHAVDNSLHDSASGFVTAGFVADQWIKISGFTITTNNGWRKIVSVDPDEMILSYGNMTDEAAGDQITIQMGARILNGVAAPSSFNIERQYKDLGSNVFSLFTGMCITSMSLEIPADAAIKGSLVFIGSREESKTSSLGIGYKTVSVTKIMTGANHVPKIFENAAEIGLLSLSLNINNNLRSRLQVGTLGTVGVGTGSMEITGALSVYFSSNALFDKYLDQTKTSLVVAVQDGIGNGYVIEIPSVMITNGSRQAGGLNTDVVGDFEWQAFVDADEGISICIVRFPAVDSDLLIGSVAGLSTVIGSITVN